MNQVNGKSRNKDPNSISSSSSGIFNDSKQNPTTFRVVIGESNPMILQRLLETMEGTGKWTIFTCRSRAKA